jgi:hypothetical protein
VVLRERLVAERGGRRDERRALLQSRGRPGGRRGRLETEGWLGKELGEDEKDLEIWRKSHRYCCWRRRRRRDA